MEIAPKHPVPVFPLPGVVLFPHTILPLHVFELRYRTMVREALSSERIIALALLQPGYEGEYHGSPPFYDLGCLARFEEVEWLPNDCYNLKVLGLSRVRFVRIVREFPYRAARVEPIEQEPYTEDDPLIQIEKRALLGVTKRWLEAAARLSGQDPPSGPSTELRYEVLVNSACMLLGNDTDEQMALLEIDSILMRGKRVRERMEARMKLTSSGPEAGGERN